MCVCYWVSHLFTSCFNVSSVVDSVMYQRISVSDKEIYSSDLVFDSVHNLIISTQVGVSRVEIENFPYLSYFHILCFPCRGKLKYINKFTCRLDDCTLLK